MAPTAEMAVHPGVAAIAVSLHLIRVLMPNTLMVVRKNFARLGSRSWLSEVRQSHPLRALRTAPVQIGVTACHN